MKKTIIDSKVSRTLNHDPLAEVEKVLGKHHSEFNNDDSVLSLGYAAMVNKSKAQYLKQLGDTYFSMSWNELLNIITNYGFVKGLQYEFDYNAYGESNKEEAILYYHPTKGLVLWATSWGNKTSVNGGTLYGQVKSKEEISYETKTNRWGDSWDQIIMTDTLRKGIDSLDRCSHGAYANIEHGIEFSYDIREGLINRIEQIGEHLEFLTEWSNKQFLWLLDYKEEKIKDYDYREITLDKLNGSPEELQQIVKVCLS